MALDPQIKAQLAQTIAVATVASRDRTGKPTYNAAANRSARVEPYRRTFQDANGRFLTTEHRIMVENEVSLTDGVWLPGDLSSDATKRRTPMRVQQAIGEDGSTSHWVVIL